jgi:hypothetical protein
MNCCAETARINDEDYADRVAAWGGGAAQPRSGEGESRAIRPSEPRS